MDLTAIALRRRLGGCEDGGEYEGIVDPIQKFGAVIAEGVKDMTVQANRIIAFARLE